MAIAEWMETGEPTFDLTAYDIRRCQPFHGNATYLADRIGEALGLHYADQFPYRSPVSARGVRTTPLHERLAERGACFGEAAGWERAAWFLPETARARGETTEWHYGWGRQNWFDYAAEEHAAVRTGVGLFDLSPFGKIRVEGRDARRAAADLRQRCGGGAGPHRLHAMAQPQGGIEADVTVTRLGPDRVPDRSRARRKTTRDADWIRRHIPAGSAARLVDITGAYAGVLGVMGPRSRDLLLAAHPDGDLSDRGLPVRDEPGNLAGAAPRFAPRASRTWASSAGSSTCLWNSAAGVYDAIFRGGRGPRNRGTQATTPIESLRVEKAYRAGAS